MSVHNSENCPKNCDCSHPSKHLVGCPKIKRSRWTREAFLETAKQIHGDKYDYSRIPLDLKFSVKARLSLVCRICGDEWVTSLSSHIYRRSGCLACAGVKPLTYATVIQRAQLIHGDSIDYSSVSPEHIVNVNSRLPLRCRICDHKWTPSIDSHIYGKHGCPNCAGQVPWNLDRTLYRFKIIHGDKYDYSRIKEEHINGENSHIPVHCNLCNHDWNPSIASHLQHGCPNCVNVAPWTLTRFLIRTNEIHGPKFDYSQVREEHIQNQNSHIPVHCNICEYDWNPSIASHLQHGCPNCAHNAPLTLATFLAKAKEIHEDKCDYSRVTEEHIHGKNSCIPIHCNTCGYDWNSTIDNHLNSKHGCPNCAGNIPLTYNIFIYEAQKIHGNRYDYSLINPTDHISSNSYVTLICINCKLSWSVRVSNHIHGRCGCPNCNKSKGQQFVLDILQEIGITRIDLEYRNPYARQYPYDFRFQYRNMWFKVEYDGQQHFDSISFFDRDTPLEIRQLRDRIKSIIACNDGEERFIRIDYTFNTKESIKDFLLKALSSDDKFILSTPAMYTWLYEPVRSDQFQQYVPNWYRQWNQIDF